MLNHKPFHKHDGVKQILDFGNYLINYLSHKLSLSLSLSFESSPNNLPIIKPHSASNMPSD